MKINYNMISILIQAIISKPMWNDRHSCYNCQIKIKTLEDHFFFPCIDASCDYIPI